MEELGGIARREYRAVGIHIALHSTADRTEPRWARIAHTFGEDAGLVARLVGAYVRGFQGAELGPDSVACVTKHFPGGGPQRDGEDPHFPYGKDQMYPGGMFQHHLRVFEAGFAAGTAQVMPYYGRPVGTPFEAVGPTCEADECEAERCGGGDLQMVAAQRRHEQEQECKRDGEGCRDRKPHHLPIGRPPEHVERLPRGNGFPWKGASYAPGDDDDLRGGRGR